MYSFRSQLFCSLFVLWLITRIKTQETTHTTEHTTEHSTEHVTEHTTEAAAEETEATEETAPDEETTDEPGATTEAECGKMQGAVPTQFRVIGGGPARIGNYPWQVIIARNKVPTCSGTVIAANYILTTATCLPSDTLSEYLVVAGTQSKYNINALGSVQLITAITRHPQFNSRTYLANVAMAQVTPEFNFSRNVGKGVGAINPICLTNSSTPVYFNTPAIVSGYGQTNGNGGSVAYLKAARITILPHANCERVFRLRGYYDRNSMVCAGNLNGGTDACYGDGGGPLAILMNNAVTQVGITSHGYGCARRGVPRIYQKVSTFYTWIMSVMEASPETKKRRAKLQRKIAKQKSNTKAKSKRAKVQRQKPKSKAKKPVPKSTVKRRVAKPKRQKKVAGG